MHNTGVEKKRSDEGKVDMAGNKRRLVNIVPYLIGGGSVGHNGLRVQGELAVIDVDI